MDFWKEIRQFGVTRTVTPQGKKAFGKPKKHDNTVDICLNCAKEVCNGNCSEIKKKRGDAKCQV